jgi:hypothetical protein
VVLFFPECLKTFFVDLGACSIFQERTPHFMASREDENNRTITIHAPEELDSNEAQCHGVLEEFAISFSTGNRRLGFTEFVVLDSEKRWKPHARISVEDPLCRLQGGSTGAEDSLSRKSPGRPSEYISWTIGIVSFKCSLTG